MHIAIFLDQHLQSLGGAQVSVRLQNKFLTQAGHQVTLIIPKSSANKGKIPGAQIVEVPSFPITPDGEFVMAWFGKSAEKFIADELSKLAPVDIVHVQADFTMAMMGHRYAKKYGIPLVHTFHSWLEVGIKSTVPTPKLLVYILATGQKWLLKLPKHKKAKSSWEYLSNFAALADARIVPTTHFEQLMIAEKVSDDFLVIPTGLDDDALDLTNQKLVDSPKVHSKIPQIIWSGRFSQEKRIMEFLQAISLVTEPAEYLIFGTGQLESKVQRYVRDHNLSDRVKLVGKKSYYESLESIAKADIMVQTSIGFETQGMTVYEAAAFGTPLVLSDKRIATEFPSSGYTLVESSSVQHLAEAISKRIKIFHTGTAPKKPYRILRQSALTQEIISIYDSVRAKS